MVLAIGLLSGADAPNASGQQSLSARFATVTGLAVDSVKGGYLRDAIVTVEGTKRLAVTGSLGRFRIDSITAGTYALRLSHPILDTLGISVVTQHTELKAGVETYFVLSVPSPATIVGRKCSATERKLGDAAAAGVVLDADTEMPSEGATVVVAWVDIALGTKSIEKTPQRRSAPVRADGTYLICGIPSDLQTGVMALRGKDSTAEVPVSFVNRLVLQSFHLPLARDAQTSSPSELPVAGNASLTGHIVGQKGDAIEGARIAVESDNAVTISDAGGAYRLNGVRAGTRLVTIRKLGYSAEERSVDFSSVTPRAMNFRLSPVSQVLETVTISAMRDIGLQRVGFSERHRLGSGTYLGPKEIEGKNSPRLGVLLETVQVLKRYSCVRYWIDGHMWSSMSDTDASLGPDAFLSGAELGAVEVYGPLTAPAEFVAVSKSGMCASVVVWTKNKIGR
jgi:hypothetical protein